MTIGKGISTVISLVEKIPEILNRIKLVLSNFGEVRDNLKTQIELALVY